MSARRALSLTAIVATMAFACFSTTPASAQVQTAADSAGIVTYRIRNFGPDAQNGAVTFGSIFARGDVPSGTGIEAVDNSGTAIPLQVDRKATHQDRSQRHAVLTLVLPFIKSGTSTLVTLRRAANPLVTTPPVPLADLPKDFDVRVDLAMGGKNFSVSAAKLLAAGKAKTWLAGPLVTEWWLAGPFRDEKGMAEPHLSAQIGIRCYGKDRPLRIETIVENDWTHVSHPRTEFYDASVRLGGRVVFSKPKMAQPSYTRWRKGFWWDTPVALYVEQNLAYLKKARVIPNYDPDLKLSSTAISDLYGKFEASDRGPMAAGIITKYMPTTGGRPDIAPLPQWQAMYLLSMEPRMYQVTLQSADLGASFAAHYRNERTGRPLTLEDDPHITTHSNFVGRPGQLEIPDTGGYQDPLAPDSSHEPALDFVPYLVTGDRFYLEELQFWSQWNATGTAPEYHGFAQALISWDQVRGQAWSLRTLAQAEYITPDSDPLKAVLSRELKANIEWYNTHFVSGPDSNALGILWKPSTLSPYEGGRSIAPWQDDFFTWSVGYVQSLGDVDALPLLRWKARFPMGRMVAPGFCWILASGYNLVVRETPTSLFYESFDKVYRASWLARPGKHDGNPDTLTCASSEMAQALGLTHAGEMVEHAADADAYSAYMQPALAAAADAGAPTAAHAWQVFANRPVKPYFSNAPGWDIVPWSSE